MDGININGTNFTNVAQAQRCFVSQIEKMKHAELEKQREEEQRRKRTEDVLFKEIQETVHTLNQQVKESHIPIEYSVDEDSNLVVSRTESRDNVIDIMRYMMSRY